MNAKREAKPLIVRDMPGIALRHMGDERNRQEAEYMFQSPSALRDATNLYSFVIENTSGKAIVALSIAYTFPKSGQSASEFGTIRTDTIQTRLMGAISSALMQSGSKVGYCLALGQENFDFKNGIRYIQSERPAHPQMTAEQQRKANEAVLSRFTNYDRLLQEADHWEVEIEGAVFEDGTFVGTNRRNYFEQSNAKIAGARSLADELLTMANKGAVHADLVARAQTYARTDWKELLKPFGGSLHAASQDESYLFHFAKNEVAHRFVGLAEGNGMNYLRYGQQHWNPLKKIGD